MLNKPKFLSPSVNMYGNNVIDLNSPTLPFSCIVDGNEAVIAWQIVVSRLSDNAVVFDTGKKELNPYFYPINNRNQNVTFNIDLKEYFTKIINGEKVSYIPYTLNTSTDYDSTRTYYEYIQSEDKYLEYKYSNLDWHNKCASLYVMDFVNSETPYYWNITLWGRSGMKTVGSEEVFYANSTPKTNIYYSYNNVFVDSEGILIDENILKNKDILSSRKIFFKADYAQDEGINIKRYGWRITDTDNNFIVIDTITQNQIYGLEDDISCECKGLLNQTNYLIELYIETQNGYFSILNNIEFEVNYAVNDIEAEFDIMALNNTSGIMLNWGNLKTTEGVVDGDAVDYTANYPISDAVEGSFPTGSISINIPRDSRVVFSNTANNKELDIDENSYVVLSFQIDKNTDVVMLEMFGRGDNNDYISRKLHYDFDQNTIVYTAQKGNTIVNDSVSVSIDSGEVCWYVATLSPMLYDDGYYVSLKLSENFATDALFPSNDLYPEVGCYPEIGTWSTGKKE